MSLLASTRSALLLALFCFSLGLITVGCQGNGDDSQDIYGFYADDPQVDRKRRDVLAPEEPTPKDEVLSTFEIADGFTIELFAAEPLIADPVAMAVDGAGNMYVVELHGYPDNETGVSQITLLRDTDGDGYPDEGSVFAEGLRKPKGIMAWKGGVLVTDAPRVMYYEDTDGDGQADIERKILDGFGHNNPQLGVNNPRYGLDNWVYAAHRSGSEVSFGGSEEVHDVSGQNVRFRPDDQEIQTLASNSQFGQTLDAWNNHFLISNSNHIYYQVIDGRYLSRNPDLLVASATEVISDHGASARVYPITPDPEYELGQAGGITSASGTIAYEGGLFPSAYEHTVFEGEPIYNIVHVDKIRKDGASLVASRMQEKREFLASTDRWFRPVNFYVGPEGALYVLDYSRQIIEQPKFLTKEILEKANLYNGNDKGRIYRIVPEGTDAPSWLNNLNLDEAGTAELVEALSNKNRWWRRAAQRMLVNQWDTSAAEPLRNLFQSAELPEARVQVLWTLEGLGELSPDLIRQGLEDEDAHVREQAIILAEKHLTDAPVLADALIAVGQDPDPHVRFQLLSTLGELESTEAQALREELLFSNVEDEWMQVAGLSARAVEPAELFDRAVSQWTEETDGRRMFFTRVSGMIGSRGLLEEVREILRQGTATAATEDNWWRVASLEGLAEGLDRQDIEEGALASERSRLLDTFFDTESAEVRGAYLDVIDVVGLPTDAEGSAVIAEAEKVATNQDADPQLRADAIHLMALSEPSAHVNLFKQLVRPVEPSPVQRAAVETLGEIGGDPIAEFVIDRWGNMTPAIRDEAIYVLLESKSTIMKLFDAIEEGTISPTAIPREEDEDLVEHQDDEIRKRANKVLRERSKKRQQVLEEYKASLDMMDQADPEEGREVFKRVCSRCHPAGDDVEGTLFGPDMAALSNRPQHWLLRQILIPNDAIADGFEQWTITRTNGETQSGVIASETPTSITLRNAGGTETTIPRKDIKSMQVSDVSAMPPGLESQITKPQMADLLAYLMSIQTIN